MNQSAFESVCHQMMNRFTRCKIMAVTLRGAINANHNTWRGILCDAGTFYHSKIYDITDVVDRVGVIPVQWNQHASLKISFQSITPSSIVAKEEFALS